MFLSGIDQSMVDYSTEYFLDEIEESTNYNLWYCGHYHGSKKIDRLVFMFEDMDILKV